MPPDDNDSAAASLVRRVYTEKAFPCFAVAEDAEPITLEQTLAAEDEL